MSQILPIPRKRRTREHVIADLAVNYVERVFLEAGHTAERRYVDYGYDLTITAFDDEGYVEPGNALLQIKASERLQIASSGNHYFFQLRTEDYNLWMFEYNPVFLVLFDIETRYGYWLYVQEYFSSSTGRKPRWAAESVRVFVPHRNRVGKRFPAHVRRCIARALRRT